jgi:PAS domain S-box-containing protein
MSISQDLENKSKEDLIKEILELRQHIAKKKISYVQTEHNNLISQENTFQKEKDIHEERILARSGSWSIQIDTGETTWSDSLFILHGIPISKNAPLLSDYLKRFVHPEDRFLLHDNIKNATILGQSFNLDLRVILPGKQLRHFHLSCKIQTGTNNKPKNILGICIDVTERKKLELQLFESKEGYKKLLQHLPEGVIIYKPERVLYANRSAFEISGLPQETNLQEQTISIFELILPEYHEEVLHKIQDVIDNGAVDSMELKIYHTRGEVIDVEVRSLLVNYKGETCIQSIFSDITYRKSVEKSLLERERQLSTLISNLPGMAFRCRNDINRTIEFASEGCVLITGYEPRVLMLNTEVSFASLIHDEDRQYVHDMIQIALKSNRSYVLNYRIINKKGQLKWIYEQGKGVYSQENELLAIEGFLTDVTRQKLAEQELMVSRENYKNLVDFLPDGIIIHKEGKIQFVNPGAQRMLKYNALENIIGKNILDIFEEKEKARIKKRIENLGSGLDQQPEEIVLLDSSGARVPAEIRTRPFFFRGSASVLEFFHDLASEKQLIREQYRVRIAEETNAKLKEEIEKRREIQTELEFSRAHVRNILNSSMDMILANDQHGKIIEFNKAAQDKFGYSKEEALELKASHFYASDEEYQKVRESITKKGVFEGEIQNVTKHGRTFTSFLTSNGLFDESGRLIGGMGVSRDITQLKADQEKLRNSEEQYKALFNQALIGIARISVDGRFLQVNEHFLKITGYLNHEIISLNREDLLHPDDLHVLNTQFHDLLSGKLQQAQTQKRIIKKDKSIIDVLTNLSVVKNSIGQPDYLVGVYEDITDRLKAQSELFEQNAKLNAILESSTHLVFSVDSRFCLVSFNLNTAALFKSVYNVNPHTGLKLFSEKLFSTEERNRLWYERISKAFSGESLAFEADFFDVEGKQSFWEVFLSPVYDNTGSVSEIACVGHNLTEKKLAETEAGNQAAKLQAIFQSSSQQMYTVNRQMELTSFNEVYEKNLQRDFGLRPYIGMNVEQEVRKHLPGSEADYYLSVQAAAFLGKPQQYEYKTHPQDVGPRFYQVYLDPIFGNRKVEEVSYIVHDITERKIAQKKMAASLQEKEILLKEVHHRVKNNLQVISSIVNLQKSYLKDSSMQDILLEIQNRIISMAFVHENLYRTNDFSTIDLNGYVSDLLSHISQSFFQHNIRLLPEISKKDIPLSLDQAIPCGLIINELVSNSFKYGFPENRRGMIKVSVLEKNGNTEICVQDNGVGFKKDFNFEESQSLGLQLVSSLVKQLDGDIKKTRAKGAGFKFTFKIR